MMTLPRLDKDLLIALASLSLSPTDSESFSLSLPARSTRFRVPRMKRKISYRKEKMHKSLSNIDIHISNDRRMKYTTKNIFNTICTYKKLK